MLNIPLKDYLHRKTIWKDTPFQNQNTPLSIATKISRQKDLLKYIKFEIHNWPTKPNKYT